MTNYCDCGLPPGEHYRSCKYSSHKAPSAAPPARAKNELIEKMCEAHWDAGGQKRRAPLSPSYVTDDDRDAMRAALAVQELGWVMVKQDDTWKPISTAPKDGTSILGYSPHWGVETYSYDADGACWRCGLRGEHCFREQEIPTHWMPLPPPPVEPEKNQVNSSNSPPSSKIREGE